MQKVLGSVFQKIQRIQIQIYSQTSIERNYGEFYLKNKVSAHGLVLLVQLSWRVASPLGNLFLILFPLEMKGYPWI